jgi:hypothetical protein
VVPLWSASKATEGLRSWGAALTPILGTSIDYLVLSELRLDTRELLKSATFPDCVDNSYLESYLGRPTSYCSKNVVFGVIAIVPLASLGASSLPQRLNYCYSKLYRLAYRLVLTMLLLFEIM